MLRSFRAQDFIQLPPLGEAGTLTLVDELEAVALATPKVPAQLLGVLARLLEACTELEKHIAVRERAGSAADPRARAADRALDDAWGAFQSWLLGWTRLPDRAHPLIADARALYAALFPKGLQFLTLDFKDEWNESQQRLDHVTEARLDDVIVKLGGKPFLVTVARCHRAYGEALHITGPRDGDITADPDFAVRRSLDAVHMAVREYVAHVAAMVRRTDSDTVAMAATLLEPLSLRAGGTDAYDSIDDDTLVSVRS
ncbi:MAG: hypothetical protein JWO86_5892 [Myxococcaceae bacterium]|nr:hypothetical protein [Myxococcaceae bacterium]